MSRAIRIRPAKLVALLLIAGNCLGVSRAGPVATPTAAPPATQAAAQAAAPAGDDADQAAQLYAVPTLRDQVGRIVAAVMINGRGPFRFMLDTGSNRTVLAQSVLAKLNLAADPEASIAVVGVTGSQVAASAHVDSLDAGAMHFRNADLAVLSGPVLYGLDGILGMEGFDGLKVSADFVRDLVTISKSRGRRAPALYSAIPVQLLSERLLMIDAHVGRVPVKAIIDTGSIRTLANGALLAALTGGQRAAAAAAPAVPASVIDATQSLQSGLTGRVPAIRLGEATIQNLDVTFGDFQIFRVWGLEHEPALLIGMDALGTLADLDIDYQRKEVDMLSRALPPPVLQKKWFSFTSW
jgi:predicted aspartyl protease